MSTGKRHNNDYKVQAVKLAMEIGQTKAANEVVQNNFTCFFEEANSPLTVIIMNVSSMLTVDGLFYWKGR